MNKGDSILRRVIIGNRGGVNEARKIFYPIYDWKKEDILKILDDNNCPLPDDYLFGNRTFNGIPQAEQFLALEKLYPEDAKRIEQWFPLIRARVARNHFRKSRVEVAPSI